MTFIFDIPYTAAPVYDDIMDWMKHNGISSRDMHTSYWISEEGNSIQTIRYRFALSEHAALFRLRFGL